MRRTAGDEERGRRRWRRVQDACVRAGLIARAVANRPNATAPMISASHMPTVASAAVAAQAIDEKASAKVATRDDVWRRRKWLRFAWVRNQNCTAVAEPVAAAIPAAETSA